MSLWVPDTAEGWNAEREQLIDRETSRSVEVVGRFNHLLKQLDDRLELVWIPERGSERIRAFAPDIVPGRWHVMRRNDAPTPHTFKAIVDEQGGFMEPHSGIFEQLAQMDMWRGDGARRKAETVARDLADRSRMLERKREEMRDEFRERYLNMTRPSISFGGSGWTNKAGARRAA